MNDFRNFAEARTPTRPSGAPARGSASADAASQRAPEAGAAPGKAMRLDTISIIGLGYIGLPTATMLAARKKQVIGVDVADPVVSAINQGRVHFVEPELDMLVRAAVHAGHLRATPTPEAADAFVIAVPTPLTSDRAPDLSHVRAAAAAIAPVLRAGNLVILESTSPVGTTEQLCAWLSEARPDLSFPCDAGEASDVRIAYCPERVLPGRVVQELVANDRVVGGITARCSAAAAELYRLFVRGDCIITDARTAEMCKLVENSFRDVNIAFANELSVICDKQGIDVWELIALANRHPRVNILQPGCGVGGHCIAVDPWFIVSGSPQEAQLIRAARVVNDAKPEWVIGKVDEAIRALAGRGVPRRDVRISCFGLSFKPDIDDLRESPALHIAQALAARHGGRLGVVEPNLAVLPSSLIRLGAVRQSLDDALEHAHICVLLVDHAEFRSVNFRPRSHQQLIDTRGVWEARA